MEISPSNISHDDFSACNMVGVWDIHGDIRPVMDVSTTSIFLEFAAIETYSPCWISIYPSEHPMIPTYFSRIFSHFAIETHHFFGQRAISMAM